MRLVINGAGQEVPDLATLADLSAWLGLPDFGSAIELNGAVIPRVNPPGTTLHEGDRLEIVRLVGGG